MRFKTIISSASAAALAIGMGAAYAVQPPPSTTPPATPPNTAQTPQTMPQNSSPAYGQTQQSTTTYQGESTTEQVANQAAAVLRNNMKTAQTSRTRGTSGTTTSQQAIPQQVVDTARCIAVFPNVASNGTAGTMGSAGTTGTAGTTGMSGTTTTTSTETAAMENTGLASCRDDNGHWSQAPVVVKLSEAKIQPQTTSSGMTGATGTTATTGTAGTAENTTGTTGTTQTTTPGAAAMQTPGQAVVLLFTSKDAAKTLQNGDVKLGEDVHVMPGPTGTAATVSQTVQTSKAPVVAYQATPHAGVAGAQIQSGKISFDQQANEQTYGSNVDPEDLLQGRTEHAQSQNTMKLIAFNQALNRFAPPSKYQKTSKSGL